MRPELSIALNGHAFRYGLTEPIAPNDEVTIVPAIGGRLGVACSTGRVIDLC